MYKKNYFLITFFILLSIFSLLRLYDNTINLDSWQYGEWLINYQYGFVRRGVIGEIIYLFSKLFNNNIQLSLFIIISAISLFYYFLSYQFIKDTKLNFIFYMIIFSPLFYLFFVVISKVGIKKEIIFYIFYLLYLFHLSSKNFSMKRNWKYMISFPILLLNHEGTFFYLPYIIFPLLCIVKIQKKEFNKLAIQLIALILLSVLFMIVLYFHKGSTEHVNTICTSLGIYAPAKCDWWGPINALSYDIHIAVDGETNLFFYIFSGYKSYLGLLFYILYSYLPLFIFYKFIYFKKENNFLSVNLFLIYLFAAFIFSFPLFHLAEDWSRWFSIHFHLLAFLIFFFDRLQLINFKNIEIFNKINFYLLNKKMKFFIILLLLYSTTFHHPHFFIKGAKLEFTYYKIFKKINTHF